MDQVQSANQMSHSKMGQKTLIDLVPVWAQSCRTKQVVIFLSMFTVAAFLNCVRLFFDESSKTLAGSYDSGWIIRTGCYILEHSAVPARDLYSWTNPDHAYIVYQWLFAALMAALFKVGGLWLAGLVCCVTAGVLYFFVLPRMWTVRGIPVLVPFCMLSLVLNSHWFEIRPQIVSFAFILVFLVALEQYRINRKVALIYCLPFVAALWSNVHLFWSIGLITVCVYWLAACWRTKSLDAPLGLALVGSLLGLLVNPYGADLIKHWWSFMDHSQWMAVYETLPPFGDPECRGQLVYLAVAAGILFKSHRSIPREGLILCGIICISALCVRRMLTPAVFVTWPYLGIALATIPWHEFLKMQYAKTAISFDRVMQGSCLIAAVILAVSVWWLRYPSPFSADNEFYFGSQPLLNLVTATVKKDDRLFNDPAVGSWLILRGSVPVFIDTRYDVYDKRFCEQFISCLSGLPGWHSYLDRMHIDYVIIRDQCRRLNHNLEQSSDWKLVADDGRLSFWKRAK
jgi:hypothetical protein